MPLVVAIAVVCAAASAVSATTLASAASAPNGTLSGSEYRQLTAEQAAFRKLIHRRRITWNQLYAVCTNVGRSTALLASVRANCDMGVGIDQSLAGFFSDAARCTALSNNTTTTTTGTGTTTTETTTTGGLTPTDLKLIACLEPEYAVISRAAKSVYEAQVELRQQVVARHFLGRCLLTLAPTHAQLSLIKRFVATSGQLEADVALVTRVADGHAPASDINGAQIERDSVAFESAGRAISHSRRPQNLSVCPHQ